METHVFTVYDSAAGFYLEPFFAPSIEFAIRGFRTAVNNEGHQFNAHPTDYTLFHIGIYEPSEGMLVSKTPSSLGVAITFIDRMELEA
jgi:hypothetical protein